MRITSSFNDYYDGVCRSNNDYDTHFVRRHSVELLALPPNINSFLLGEVVFFAGRWIPYCFDCFDDFGRYSAIYGEYKGTTVGDGIDRNSGVSRMYMDYDSLPAKDRRASWTGTNDAEAFFRTWNTNPPAYAVDLVEKYGPIFKLARYHGWRYDANYVDNGVWIETAPRLETLGFAKFLHVHDAYHLLTQWLCNRGREPYIPEMPNDIKIQQAGFDLKTSFRKSPSKNKGKH